MIFRSGDAPPSGCRSRITNVLDLRDQVEGVGVGPGFEV